MFDVPVLAHCAIVEHVFCLLLYFFSTAKGNLLGDGGVAFLATALSVNTTLLSLCLRSKLCSCFHTFGSIIETFALKTSVVERYFFWTAAAVARLLRQGLDVYHHRGRRRRRTDDEMRMHSEV